MSICPVLGVDTSGRREDMGKECGRVNMLQKLCTKYANEKMRHAHKIKENDEAGEFKYDIFDIL
jgi:hypothetical protein